MISSVLDSGETRWEDITNPLSQIPFGGEGDVSDRCEESDDTAKAGSHPQMMFTALHVMTHVLKCAGHDIVLSRTAMK